MILIDLFSGIGGFRQAMDLAGVVIEKEYFSEIDKHAVAVYAKRFPNAVALGDISKVDWTQFGKGEYFVTGGFPCQPHSVAGKRKASGDERDLWGECVRCLEGVRPKYSLFENVPGLLTSEKGEFFGRVLSDIHRVGYDCEYRILSAADVGAPHQRKRVWISCYRREK